MKKRYTVLIFILILSVFAGCAGRVHVNYKKANEEFDEYLRGKKLPSYFFSGYKDFGDYLKYDITGDGYDDLIRLCHYGSGMPRVSFAVYDPINHKGYNIDSYNYSYSIEKCEKGELFVIKYEGRKDESITGTIIFEDDSLVFVEK